MLKAHGLTCRRGGRELFAGVGFALGPGEWLHVRGANGSGKTSLLRILAALSPADAGSVQWDGIPLAHDLARWRGDCLFLGHAAAVKDELTPLENLQAASALDGRRLESGDALRALRRFGLRGREDVPVRFLSAGQRRRALLARTLTRPATAWILDEPLTALDARAIEDFSGVLTDHLAQGGLAVLTSHQPLAVVGARELAL
jgi:heme exporter protein A